MNKHFKNEVYVVVIDGDNEITFNCDNPDLGAPVKIDNEDFLLITDAIGAVLALLGHALPNSATGFNIHKAERSLRKEQEQLADRMKAAAEPDDNELPF